MTNFTPNIFVWLFEGLKQSRLARDDLIALIIIQNILFMAFVVTWIALYGRSRIRDGKPSHAYLEPTTQRLTEPILIHVTKVVTVKTEEIAMHTPFRAEGTTDTPLDYAEVGELSDLKDGLKRLFCEV